MASVARRSSFALILVLTLLAALAVQGSGAAVTKNVSMVDNDFVPANLTVIVGDSVLWKNDGSNPHTTTGDDPLSLWDSARLDGNETFLRQFKVAGTYPYLCDFHDGQGMVGDVLVRIKAPVISGIAGTRFRLTIATETAIAPFVYDVQIKAPGGTYTSFKSKTTNKAVVFNSTDRAPGVYQFRARLRNLSNGDASGWSPARSITVTP